MIISKKMGLALMAMGMSSMAFAGTYTPPACTSHAVTIPCEGNAWDVGFEVLWVDTTTHDQNYAFSNNDLGSEYVFAAVNPDYQFGFELNGSYHFATGNDLTVRWTRIHNDQDDVITAKNTQVLTNYGFGLNESFFAENTLVLDGTKVTSSHDYEFDAINAELGQHIDVGDDMDLRVHAGLQYARIDYTKALRFTNSSTSDETLLTMDSELDAIGARVGADASYALSGGFSFVGHASLSLLIGEVESELNARADDSDNRGQLKLRQHAEFESDEVVVPAGMIKVGFNYGADLLGGQMALEGGWRWEGYFQSTRFVPAAGADFENFTFSGPYLAISYLS